MPSCDRCYGVQLVYNYKRTVRLMYLGKWVETRFYPCECVDGGDWSLSEDGWPMLHAEPVGPAQRRLL